MGGNYGLIGFDFFEDINNDDIKSYLIDFLEE
jgi:hypothetical protein